MNNIRTLNALQVAFLFDISKEQALYEIYKAREDINGFENLKTQRYNKRTQEYDLLKSDFIDTEIDVDLLAAKKELNIGSLLKSINEDFTKDQKCAEYLMRKLVLKYRPGKLGMYPITISLPIEVSSLLTDSGKERVLEYARRVFPYKKDKNGDIIPLTIKA